MDEPQQEFPFGTEGWRKAQSEAHAASGKPSEDWKMKQPAASKKKAAKQQPAEKKPAQKPAKAAATEQPQKLPPSKPAASAADAESPAAPEEPTAEAPPTPTDADGDNGNNDSSEPTHMPDEPPGPLKSMMAYNFLEYAAYVICDRAIPSIEDGLKPVQRRILYSLHERDDGRFTKVANVVGHCMQYHPHGDASIGDALVNLTNKRYVIEGQGNFGNIYTGDSAAAARYIECRLTPMARDELFNDELTEFVANYDGRKKEPVVLPSKLPMLLMLGAEGIAVGLSTRILPHNFSELIEAQIAILRKQPFEVFPDYQQGGLIDVSDYNDGVGKVKLRARIEKAPKGRLIIKEVPPGTTTESLINSIEEAVKKKKVPVRSINDYTAEVVEIELILTPGAKMDKAIDALYAFTSCQTSITSRPVVIIDRKPVDMTVSGILQHNTMRFRERVEAELELRKRKLQDDFHTKTLVQIFIENRIYKQIEQCKTLDAVHAAITKGLKPFEKKLAREATKEDREMLLSVRIRRISLFDISKHREEIERILEELAAIEKDLKQMTRYCVRYLKRLLKTYGPLYPRCTEITSFKQIEVRALTSTELTITIDKENGYVGHNVKGGETLFDCSSLDKILIFWADGRYMVMPPPEKLFVDQNMLYCAKVDKDRVMTVVYTEHDIKFTFMKRFNIGGFILNREYRFAPEKAKVRLLRDDDPETLYVKYRGAKGQRIHQQVFRPRDTPVKGVKARGNQMTAKTISRIAMSVPTWWDENDGAEGHLL
jgi:topoisomerase-4 subunit A